MTARACVILALMSYLNKRKFALLAALITVGLIMWIVRSRLPSPAFREVQQLQSQLLKKDALLKESDQLAGWTRVKQLWPSLSDAEKKELKRPHQAASVAKVAKYAQLDNVEARRAFLDTELAVWEKKFAAGEVKANAKNGNKATANSKSAEQRGDKVWDEAAIREKTRRYLDTTTPEERAYNAALKERWYETHEEHRE